LGIAIYGLINPFYLSADLPIRWFMVCSSRSTSQQNYLFAGSWQWWPSSWQWWPGPIDLLLSRITYSLVHVMFESIYFSAELPIRSFMLCSNRSTSQQNYPFARSWPGSWPGSWHWWSIKSCLTSTSVFAAALPYLILW
jgi:hypothetical protein